MKLVLVNDQGDPVACLDDVERYDVQKSSSVFALLDFLETLIAAAKRKGGAPESLSNARSEAPQGKRAVGAQES